MLEGGSWDIVDKLFEQLELEDRLRACVSVVPRNDNLLPEPASLLGRDECEAW
jgi:hypothetical protein